jgi:hypothetical protein
MAKVVLDYRCGAAPEWHRVPFSVVEGEPHNTNVGHKI